MRRVYSILCILLTVFVFAGNSSIYADSGFGERERVILKSEAADRGVGVYSDRNNAEIIDITNMDYLIKRGSSFCSIDLTGLSWIITSVTFDLDDFSDIADVLSVEKNDKNIFTIKMDTGTVSFNRKAMNNIKRKAKSEDITISILKNFDENRLTQKQRDVLTGEDIVAYKVSITSGNKEITEFSGEMSLTLSYEGKLPMGAYHINAEGLITELESEYNENTKEAYLISPERSSLFILAPFANYEPEGLIPFEDVGIESEYYKAVKYVYENSLMNGIDETTFEPEGNLTRAMATTILYRMEDEPYIRYTKIFTDIEKGQWYSKPIVWCNSNEIVTGYSDGTFGYKDLITKEQLVTILYRYAKYSRRVDDEILIDDSILEQFADREDISEYAIEGVKWALSANLFKGMKKEVFEPKKEATRAEMAAFIKNFREEI